MSKPKDPLLPLEDSVSLHTNPGGGSNSGLDHLLDDADDDVPHLGSRGDDDELPPLYTDVADSTISGGSSQPLLANQPHPPTLASAYYAPPNAVSALSIDQNSGAECYMDKRLDSDPELLASHVAAWATRPPRMFVQVMGTHHETVDNHGKKERKKVTDFDVRVELTPYLYSDATNRVSWREVRTVENSEKAHRGTVWATRAPGSKQSIEVGGSPKPSLAEWCHMYCASHAGLKSFTLRRRVVGFDQDAVREKMIGLVRASNYRGHIEVRFPLVDERVDVYNECGVNRWRLTQWVRIVFFITLLFLFVWPFLFFGTKHFEVVASEWPFSRPGANGRKEYVSLSEDQWYNLWGRAIHKAVLEKRQCTLDQQDLINSQGAEPTFQSGQPLVDGAMGFLRAGVNAMNEVNRQFGWGGDR